MIAATLLPSVEDSCQIHMARPRNGFVFGTAIVEGAGVLVGHGGVTVTVVVPGVVTVAVVGTVVVTGVVTGVVVVAVLVTVPVVTVAVATV